MKSTDKVVLDASALLALLNQEIGHAQVEKHLSNAVMSAVNISEVVATYTLLGAVEREVESLIHSLVKEIIPFDTEQAFIAGFLRKKTKAHGLSLGDRACLALAELKNLPVLTADKIWAKLDIKIHISVIR
jgi:PIN domain nuclease of toxin-antitoxin system